MRRSFGALAAAAWLLAVPLNAETRGWYAAIEGGLEFDGHFDIHADSGFALIATAGHNLGQNFSLEGEVGYRSTTFADYAYDVDQVSVMLNAVYETSVTEQLSLSLGGGIGADFIHAKFPPWWLFAAWEDDSVQFAGQLKAGLSFELSETTDLVANYRYMKVFDGDFGELENSTLTVGLRFAL